MRVYTTVYVFSAEISVKIRQYNETLHCQNAVCNKQANADKP